LFLLTTVNGLKLATFDFENLTGSNSNFEGDYCLLDSWIVAN